MLYYYAHTGHKIGLDRARRAMAVVKKLERAGVETGVLFNDFRAGVAMKEEQGLGAYVTIETVQDIDAIVQTDQSVIIDSDEDDHGRLVKFVSDFRRVWRFAHDAEDRSVHGETLFKTGCEDAACLEALIVDETFSTMREKEDRTLLFLRDHDHDKLILNNPGFFKAFDMELLLGHYFFVKYEDDLAEIFGRLHEPEEYTELIGGSATVVTGSAQTAMEAKASGAKTIFLKIEEKPIYPVSLLESYGIEIVDGLDEKALSDALARAKSGCERKIPDFDAHALMKNL